MYEPKDRENPKYIVFAKLDGRMIPGVGVKCVLSMLLALLVGLVIFFALGTWVHVVDVPVSASESLMQTQAYSTERSALLYESSVQRKEELSEIKDKDAAQREELRTVEADITKYGSEVSAEKERTLEELVSDAEEDGITSESSDEDIAALVPTTRQEDQEVMPGWMRAIIFVVFPAFVAFAITFEWEGKSASGTLAAWIAYKRTVKTYAFGGVQE